MSDNVPDSVADLLDDVEGGIDYEQLAKLANGDGPEAMLAEIILNGDAEGPLPAHLVR